MLLSIDVMSVLSKILQLICCLSIIVIIHELGHFIPAKIFGCRVEKFYLFFPAWFSIIKKKIGDTVYGIGWIPFGGFVKISGMIDESLDKDQMKKPPEPWELRSKSPWQRIIVMGGGVFLNMILGIIIFIGVSYHYGDEYIQNKNLKYGLHFHESVKLLGFHDGDIVLKIGDKQIENYNQIIPELVFGEQKNILVLRNGDSVTLNISPQLLSGITKNASKKILIIPRFNIIVDSVIKDDQFIKNQLLKGDVIISFNGAKISFFNELENIKQHFADSVVKLGVERNGKKEIVGVKLNAQGAIGFIPVSFYDILKSSKHQYTFIQSIGIGIDKAYKTLANNLTGLKMLFTSKNVKVNDNLGGIISIGNLFPSSFTGQQFWILTAILSLIIGIMNLLPIPALDGGHIVLALYEGITRKKPSVQFQNYAQMVGMVLLFGLMIYALGLDIFRLLK